MVHSLIEQFDALPQVHEESMMVKDVCLLMETRFSLFDYQMSMLVLHRQGIPIDLLLLLLSESMNDEEQENFPR